MFKLVVLLSVAAMAAAKPSVVAYSSVVPAVSSVSQYSSSVNHGSPLYSVPAVYSAGVYGAPVYSAPVALAQAPHSPAVVLDAVNGVPLDTPEVVAARAAHYQAKALSGFHHLRKRSVVTPVTYSVSPVPYSSPAVVSAYGYSPSFVSAYSSPLVSAYSTPVVAGHVPYAGVRALSVHPY